MIPLQHRKHRIKPFLSILFSPTFPSPDSRLTAYSRLLSTTSILPPLFDFRLSTHTPTRVEPIQLLCTFVSFVPAFIWPGRPLNGVCCFCTGVSCDWFRWAEKAGREESLGMLLLHPGAKARRVVKVDRYPPPPRRMDIKQQTSTTPTAKNLKIKTKSGLLSFCPFFYLVSNTTLMKTRRKRKANYRMGLIPCSSPPPLPKAMEMS